MICVWDVGVLYPLVFVTESRSIHRNTMPLSRAIRLGQQQHKKATLQYVSSSRQTHVYRLLNIGLSFSAGMHANMCRLNFRCFFFAASMIPRQ